MPQGNRRSLAYTRRTAATATQATRSSQRKLAFPQRRRFFPELGHSRSERRSGRPASDRSRNVADGDAGDHFDLRESVDIGVCLALCLGRPANAGVPSKQGALELRTEKPEADWPREASD